MILFVCLIVVLLLPACASNTAGATMKSPVMADSDAKSGTSVGNVEIIWYVRKNDNEQKWETEMVISDFEAKNPTIKINLLGVAQDNFDSRLQAMIAAGAQPDIWSHWGSSGFQDYAKRSLVADLTPYIEKDHYDLADFIPEVLDIYKVDGKIMGLPISTGGSFIFYNKKIFDAAGVAYPPTNWDDKSWNYDAYVEKCKQLTSLSVPFDSQQDVFGCYENYWPNDQFAWIWGQDFYPISAYETGFADTAYLDDQAVIDAFQARQDLVWDYHYAPTPAELAVFDDNDIFMAGKVAMIATGVWGWWKYSEISDFKWGVAALPYGADTRFGVTFTDPWLMSSKSAHPEEAWTFLKYLCSPEIQAQWSELTGAPPVRKSLQHDWVKRFPGMAPEDVKEVFDGALQYGRESPSHMLVKFDQLNRITEAAIAPIVSNQKSAAETLPVANQALIKTLRQIQNEYQK